MAKDNIIDLPDLAEKIEQIKRWEDNGSGPGDGGGGTMEPRVAKLEASVQHIESDIGEIKLDVREIRKEFKTVYGFIIAAVLGLAGLMAKGFGWL